MRLPLPAVLAALAIAAAGSVVLTAAFKQPYYTINARNLTVGQKFTVMLDFVPYRIYLLGKASAVYSVTVNVTGAWFEYETAMRNLWEWWEYGNRIIVVGPVVHVDGPVSCNITVRRVY
jgi:hypothetical protein